MPPRQSALPPVRAFFPSRSPFFPLQTKAVENKEQGQGTNGQVARVWQPRGERVMGGVANHGKRQRWPAVRQVRQPIRSSQKVPGKRNGWRALRAPQRPIRQAPKPMPEVAAYHVHGLDLVRFHFHHFSGPCPCLRHGLLLFLSVPVCGSKVAVSVRGAACARAFHSYGIN